MRKIIKERIDPKLARNDYDCAYIMSLALDVGEEMLISGGEINRVETTVLRILETYDCTKVNVFALPGFMSVSLLSPDGEVHSQSRRIYTFNNNMSHLEDLNELSRYVCANRPTVKEFYERLDGIQLLEYKRDTWVNYFAHFLGSASFTVFFGGSFLDALVAGGIGLFIALVKMFSRLQRMNRVVYTLFISMLAGAIAVPLCYFGIGQHLAAIIIGDIMLLVPGALLTLSLRDMLCGDIIAGLFRAIESILVGGAIGAGYAIPLLLMGGLL